MELNELKSYIDNMIVETDEILIPRRSKDERDKNYIRIINKRIEKYIKNGMVGDLNLRDLSLKVFKPSKLTKIGKSLSLSNCKSLITFAPENLKEIGEDLFMLNCINLQEFNPKNLTKISGDLTFEHDENLILFNPIELRLIGGNLYLRDTPFVKQFDDNENKCRKYLLDRFGLTVTGDIRCNKYSNI